MEEQKPPGARQQVEPRARHGYRNEVNWEGGSVRGEMPSGTPFRLSGRQPYGNQGPAETPSSGPEYADGNRRERSGRTLEHLRQAKGTPR